MNAVKAIKDDLALWGKAFRSPRYWQIVGQIALGGAITGGVLMLVAYGLYQLVQVLA